MASQAFGAVDESSLTRIRILGRGSFGSVSLMVDSNHQLYAKKSSYVRHLKMLEKELRIMLLFHNHPHIVQALSPNLHYSSGMVLKDCSIYMEFASIGSLDKIISDFGNLTENIIGRSTRMILQGLEALHSEGYVHCDLKPANILLFPSKFFGEPWDLKLSDFGLCKEPNTDPNSLSPGTKYYMPPESVGRDGVIGPALDIWSLGCVVFEMFGGEPVKLGDSYVWKTPHVISPVAIDFLRQCHAWDPSRRASATELLNHPFIRQRVSNWPMVPISPRRSIQPEDWPMIRTLPTINIPQEDWPMIPRLPGSIW